MAMKVLSMLLIIHFYLNSIFGFGYESMGKDFEKFHHVFVLRACLAGEVGGIIPGISPGAEILLPNVF
jgi:hypothetical protein